MSFIVLAPKSDLHWERALYNVMGEIKNRPSFSLPFYETREEAEKEYPDVAIFELPLTDGERLKLRNHVSEFIKETIII